MVGIGRQLRNIIAVLAAVSVLLLTQGHGRSVLPLDADLAAYVQAGGDLGDLCLGDGSDPSSLSPDCPDCTLCKMAVAAGPAADQMAGFVFAAPLASEPVAPRGENDTRGPPARGPPQLLV